MSVKSTDNVLSDAETVRRREGALKKMLSTPPRPHSDSKVSRKPKAKKPARIRRK
jgi:hypothetical protein